MNIRPARESDIPDMLRLVSDHARRGDLLPRTALSIRETLGDWLVGKDEDGDIVACVSLFYHTAVLADPHDRSHPGPGQQQVRQGFLRRTEQWETHVQQPTKRLKINVVFPKFRPPLSTTLIEQSRHRSHSRTWPATGPFPTARA